MSVSIHRLPHPLYAILTVRLVGLLSKQGMSPAKSCPVLPTSPGFETKHAVEVETAFRALTQSRIVVPDASVNYGISSAYFTSDMV